MRPDNLTGYLKLQNFPSFSVAVSVASGQYEYCFMNFQSLCIAIIPASTAGKFSGCFLISFLIIEVWDLDANTLPLWGVMTPETKNVWDKHLFPAIWEKQLRRGITNILIYVQFQNKPSMFW